MAKLLIEVDLEGYSAQQDRKASDAGVLREELMDDIALAVRHAFAVPDCESVMISVISGDDKTGTLTVSWNDE